MIFLKAQLTLIFSILTFSFASQALVPIMYGGEPEMDACSTYAQVAYLSEGPDGFLAVKDSPNLKAKRMDKILNGQSLWICEESKDGLWFGIVYPLSEKQECGVTSPVEKRKAYKGPCKSGWVSKKYVKVLAG